jgi:Matrixin
VRNLRQVFLTIVLAGLASAQPALHLKTLRWTPAVRARALRAPLKTRTLGRSHLLVQFANSPSDAQLKELANRGVRVLSYVPDFGLSVSASNDTRFDGLNLRWVGRLAPEEKTSPELNAALARRGPVSAVVEFYSDVDPNEARVIANAEGLVIKEHPDLLRNHLLLRGTASQFRALTEWDEVSYVFPASQDLLRGTPVRACAGALTKQGLVAQAVALVDQGWAPGKGGANLKYAFVHTTERLPVDSAESEIVRAFNEWAKYAKLTFTPTSNATDNQTISVLFASGAHGDGYPFDGPGGVLAHTFYPVPTNPEPVAGDMHFDDDESWNIGANVDVFSIALHEAGHALGLGHSDNPDDVMYPYYHMHTGLSQGDIAAILQLYAPQDGTSSTSPMVPVPAPAPPSPLSITIQPAPSSTTAASLTISGTTAGGSGPVEVSWSAGQGTSGTARGSTEWTVAAVPLGVGVNVITITATDSQQNSVSQSVTVTRQQVLSENPPSSNPLPPSRAPGPDRTPPSLTLLSPASTNVATSASSLVVSGTASDNVGVASVTWSSSTGASGAAVGTSQWSTPPITLYIGTTTVIIRAYDAAGNSSWRSLTITRR